MTPRADYALRFLSPSGYQYATPVDGDNGAAQSGARPDTDAGMLVDLSIAANADITGQSRPSSPAAWSTARRTASRWPAPWCG